MRHSKIVVLAILVLGLTACPQRAHLWIEPNSRTDHLRFQIGRSEGQPAAISIGVFRVDPCSAPEGTRPAWVVEGDTEIDMIEYGRIPPGFSEIQAPAVLDPGCYRATVSGSPGVTTFSVDTNGIVREHVDR